MRNNHEATFNEALNITLIIYAFLLPFSNAFSVFSGPYILLLFWFLDGNLNEKVDKLLNFKPIVFLTVFIAFATISTLWSSNFVELLRNIKFYLAVLIPFAVIYTSKLKYFRFIVIAFLSGMFISEILLYGVFFEWWSIKKATPDNPSPFMHHVLYSIFLASTIFILIWQILNRDNPIKIKLLEGVFLISTTVNLFLNSGRTGQVVFLISFFIFLISYYGMRLKYLLFSVIGFIFIFSFAYNFSPIFHARVQQGISDIESMQKGNFNTSWGLRVVMKEEGFKIVEQNPIFGVGVGDDKDTIREYLGKLKDKYPYFKKLNHIHDQYLQILIQIGVFGLILFAIFIVSVFREVYYDSLAKSILFAVVTLFLIAFFIDSPLRNFTSSLFGFLLGVLTISAKGESFYAEK